MVQWEGDKEIGLAPYQKAGEVGGRRVERPEGYDPSVVYEVDTPEQERLKRKQIESPTATWSSPEEYGRAVRYVRSSRGEVSPRETIFIPGPPETVRTPGSGKAPPEFIARQVAEARMQKPTYFPHEQVYKLQATKDLEAQEERSKKTFTVYEGRVAREYYVGKGSDFGKNLFGQYQGKPEPEKAYRRSWFGSYIEVPKRKETVVSKERLQAIATADIYAPMFAPLPAFRSTAMLKGASLNIKPIKVPNILRDITGKPISEFTPAQQKAIFESRINYERVGVTDRRTLKDIPTYEDLFGKRETSKQPDAARTTRGGEPYDYTETREYAEYQKAHAPKPPTIAETEYSKQLSRYANMPAESLRGTELKRNIEGLANVKAIHEHIFRKQAADMFKQINKINPFQPIKKQPALLYPAPVKAIGIEPTSKRLYGVHERKYPSSKPSLSTKKETISDIQRALYVMPFNRISAKVKTRQVLSTRQALKIKTPQALRIKTPQGLKIVTPQATKTPQGLKQLQKQLQEQRTRTKDEFKPRETLKRKLTPRIEKPIIPNVPGFGFKGPGKYKRRRRKSKDWLVRNWTIGLRDL